MQPQLPSPPSPSLAVRLFRPLAYTWLKVTRFKVVGEMPAAAKFVIIANPHTTNWDLPYTLAAGLHYGVRVNWMGKTSIFKFPFGSMMRWLGGISVERSKSTNAVTAMVETFARAERMALVIAPSGTRSATAPWKSGFYHIAHGAGVPLVLAFINYNTRTVGIAGTWQPTGDYDADLAAIQAIYAKVLMPIT
jgi:1-acyl-sn-glycerol-3-phosphate acyltransferase